MARYATFERSAADFRGVFRTASRRPSGESGAGEARFLLWLRFVRRRRRRDERDDPAARCADLYSPRLNYGQGVLFLGGGE